MHKINLQIFLIFVFRIPSACAADLTAVNDWLYVISMDDISIREIADSGYDLAVMDYSRDGSDEEAFTANDVQILHDAGMTAIAYFSIGEAEDYRFYWRDEWNENPPDWLGPTNPDWEGNYKVRYWMDEWKSILFGESSGPDRSYLDKIIDSGFDGVYLDIVDAFEYWSDENPELTRFEARKRMKDLIGEIRDRAIVQRGLDRFYIFPQNAPAIIVDDNDELDDLGLEYLQLCDGIGAEDTWFNETDPQDPEETEYVVALLDLFKTYALHHLVLSVDYVWDANAPNSQENADRYDQFHKFATDCGFLSYAAISDRDLNEILIQPAEGKFQYPQPAPQIPSTHLFPWFCY